LLPTVPKHELCHPPLNGLKVAEDSFASRSFTLAGARVELIPDVRGPSDAPHVFRLVAPTRAYSFSASSETDRAGWMAVLTAEITAADDAVVAVQSAKPTVTISADDTEKVDAGVSSGVVGGTNSLVSVAPAVDDLAVVAEGGATHAALHV
jgi:hypothetical protein